MAMPVPNVSGHIQNQLERILEEADQSGELKLSNKKLKDFPKTKEKFNLGDTVIADLSKNRFTELPDIITGFYFLERLQCYHNSIRTLPDAISNLQCLSFLDLSRNQLTALPRELCQLPIEILLVANNRLSSLPDELYKMSQLTELDASCNQITHFPPRMGELKSLQSLVLRNNLLLAVPVEITSLRLVRLDLRANRISTLPIEIRGITTVIDLMLDENPLTSPPASLCKRGRVHIFKYLDMEAMKIEKKTGGGTGTLGRRSRKSGSGSPGPPHLVNRLKNKRHNVDSGYSTSSDCCEKRWSQEIAVDDKNWPSTPVLGRSSDQGGTVSTISTPSTISPAPPDGADEDLSKSSGFSNDNDRSDAVKELVSVRLSPCPNNVSIGDGTEDKPKIFQQIQTYREYKEALKQQRAHDVPSIYRTKDSDEQSNKTEPNTPTHHHSTPGQTMATSKSDPTPLNSAFGGPKTVFDDTSTTKKPVQKVTPSRNTSFSPNRYVNGNVADNMANVHEYIKPASPVKASVPQSTGALSSYVTNYKEAARTTFAPKSVNGVKSGRNISWNKDVASDKISFTMRREIDKAREESDLINQLRNIIETRLKMALPENLAAALTDGVVLCHLANHIRPRSVASIHVPSPAVPKLTMARCRRNVDNFIEACRKIGVDENLICCAADVLEGKGLVQVAVTVMELIRFHSPRSPLHATSVSTVV
ncbi:leucine-rich repeat and calponin homology domain-containing protein isoform X2 [Cylas formicarius]|uniref:leucine-rich repeat and calponin homology domain-containing protein isoform X2 n=1 Tax=Cylas formicarius TaxID=197179 RepID=UPI0029583AD3|nr:leucine-rich repeat and calponin homology domain-containing protein isoform X2 [Cylas formicarius]